MRWNTAWDNVGFGVMMRDASFGQESGHRRGGPLFELRRRSSLEGMIHELREPRPLLAERLGEAPQTQLPISVGRDPRGVVDERAADIDQERAERWHRSSLDSDRCASRPGTSTR